MKKQLISLSVLAGLIGIAGTVSAEAYAEESSSPHEVAYNIGLFSQYTFRGLTQTDGKAAIQGGVDYSHSSGFYLGAWASNINWLADSGNYSSSSLELDIYGGYSNTIGQTEISYDVGLLNYIYPGSKTDIGRSSEGFDDPYTLEVYGALSWRWFTAKISYALTDDVFGVVNADDTYYIEANASIPIGESGFVADLHVGRQEFSGGVTSAGIDNDQLLSYTDWKIGLSKSWSNGVNIGGYYSDTTAKDDGYTVLGDNLGDSTFTVFLQKTF